MYTVEWTQLALDRLTDLLITLSSDDWERLTATVDELDRRLKHDPVKVGESRHAMERIAFVGPLIVSFDVHETSGRVSVLAVSWREIRES